MTRRRAAAPTASRSGSRSSASGATTTETAKATTRKAARKAAKATAAPLEPAEVEIDVEADAAGADGAATPPKRRGRARRGDGDRLREQILDATHALLIETGSVDKVSTRAVAHRVGCSSPALYLHFPDKASLLWATCNRQFLRLRELAIAACEGIDDPVEALRQVGRAYVHFGVEHAEEYRVMVMMPETAIWDPAYEDLPQEAGFDILFDLITRAMASGQLRPDDPTLVALSVWTTVHGIVALRIAKPAFSWPPLDDMIERTLELVLHGLAADDAPDPATGGPRGARSGRSAGRGTAAAGPASKGR